MSKSLGNIRYINDLINDYNGETLRLVLLSTHYRQPLNWSTKAIDQAQKTLDRLYRVVRKADSVTELDTVKPSKCCLSSDPLDFNIDEAGPG